MRLSVQRSVVESFKFNNKNIRAFFLKTYIWWWGTTKKMGSRPCNGLFQKSTKCRDRHGSGGQNCPPSSRHGFIERTRTLLLSIKMQEGWGWTVHGVGCGNSFTTRGSKINLSHWRKNAALALLTDDLQDRDNQIQAIKYKNVALQAQRDVYQAELQKCQDTITHLKTSYVPHARDVGKDNIIIIVGKHTTPASDKYHDLPYYVARIQRHKRYVKLRWFDRHFLDHEVIVEIDNPNSIHAFNQFEAEGHAEWKYNHFRLIDLTREELYTMGAPAILDDEEE